MPIFISYSRQDSPFVDKLVISLIKRKHIVWLDKWEINVGDSLLDKIQGALTDSSAILVILSKRSIQSEWCKRELKGALTRELEEKKTLVIPCRIEDCAIPLFLRDKLYADFHVDYNKAVRDVDRALARISNAEQSRIESPDFNTDWSVDWKPLDEKMVIDWCFVDHSKTMEYVVVSRCIAICNPTATRNFHNAIGADTHHAYMAGVMECIVRDIGAKGLKILITDGRERTFRQNRERENGRAIQRRAQMSSYGQ
jgi:hypothetical protein